MQQVRGRAVSTRPRRAKTQRTSGVSSPSPRHALCEPPVRKSPNNDATRRRMAQKTSYRAESAVLLRGAAGTSGAQKLVTRPTGRPEEGTTATGGAQRAGIALAAFSMPSEQRPMGAGAVWAPARPAGLDKSHTAVQTGSARANYYRKGSKSDSSGCLQRRGTAAARQGEHQGAAPSSSHAFIAYARPVTIT